MEVSLMSQSVDEGCPIDWCIAIERETTRRADCRAHS